MSNFEKWGCREQIASTRARLKKVEAPLREPELRSSITLRQALRDTCAQRGRALATIGKHITQAQQAVIAAQQRVADLEAQ